MPPSHVSAPARRRSPGRMRTRSLLVVPLLMALGAPAAPARATTAPLGPTTWYAPYVDATLPPEYPSADTSANPARQTAFGFVVAASAGSCAPSWGTFYGLSGIDRSQLALGSVLSAMRAEGEVPIVSFGGEANQSLADACTSASALTAAYAQVVAAYHLRVLDFDIEGAAQGRTGALARQARAIHALQARAGASGGRLGVWLTLPVATTGMLPVAEHVVDAMLNGGVDLSGVNLMTMYFSPSPGDGAPMLSAVEGALTASNRQLRRLFAAHGIPLGTAQVWAHMGATVQIGQASVPDQAFTVADARGLVGFASAHGLGRVSDWSANQDAPCGSASAPSVGGYSNLCSGVVQAAGQFGTTFARLTGSATATRLLHPRSASSVQPPAPSRSAGRGAAPPRTPPPRAPRRPVAGSYPAWSPSDPYPAGAKVVAGGEVYAAKWWNRGVDPTTPAAHPWDTPWKPLFTIPGEASAGGGTGG